MTEGMEMIALETRDGTCPAYVFRPAGEGPWPAVLVFMDGIGIRPAMLAVGERLATLGVLALMPDVFYRSGPYAPMDAKTVFADPEQRRVLMEKFFALATTPNVMSDVETFLAHLAGRADVRPGKVAVTGYCLGGFLALNAAGTYADRIAVAASFHGGRLATDAPDSPHRLAATMRTKVYVAGAIDDASFPDAMKDRLEAALTDAAVDHRVETYPARHGWVLTDTLAYDADAAERHWTTLAALLREAFGDAQG